MKYPIGITLIGFLMVVFLGMPTIAQAAVSQDDIGAALAQPDGSEAAISNVEIIWAGKSGRSFAIKESGEAQPPAEHPRLVVVSTLPLPVSSYWNCDVSGELSTYSGISRRDGNPYTQRVLIVSPEDVAVYCSSKGRPILFAPPKSLGIDWPYKRTLAEIADECAATSGMMIMEEEPLPPLPDSPYSSIPANYCATIADARAQYSPTARVMVELQCRPFSDVTSTQFTLEEDSSTDSITVYYTGSSALSGRVNRIVGTIQKDEYDEYWIEVDSGPNWQAEDVEGRVQAIPATSEIAYARTLADGGQVTLTGHIVSADRTDFPNAIYVQDPNRAAGIRVLYTGALQLERGDEVDVSGIIGTGDDLEREIDAGTTGVTYVDDPGEPAPVGMNNRSLGGGDFNVLTPGVNWPYGSGTGLYNKGLLVKIWGRVTLVDADNKCFYVDDGTGFNDGSGHTGVKVSWDWPTAGKPSILPPLEGWYVTVTGISSSEDFGSLRLIRTLRPRSQDDLLTLDPQDTTYPELSITTPPGNEIRKAVGTTSVQLSGTATDAGTEIVSVEVKIDAGVWQPATYSSTTNAWSYTWQDPVSATVWVRAMNSAGHTSVVSRDITVITVTFVSKTGSGGSGAEWGSAKRTIQEALNISPSGSEVWVKQGVYAEKITVPNGVSLYGGFYGNETSRSQRDWSTYVTIIDARTIMPANRVVDLPANATSTTRIDGFTIRNGTASSGGGIYCPSGSPIIVNNTITCNTATSGSAGDGGGGIYCYSGSPEIRNNKICGNSGAAGGGIYSGSGSVKIYNNTIVNNSATEGGGVYCSDYSSAQVSNNIVAFNSSGLYKVTGSGVPVLKNNCVYRNGVYDYAGLSAGTGDISSDPRIAGTQYMNLHIQPDSPCRDVGDNSVVQPNWSDIDGQIRIQGDSVDIGADESDGTVWAVSTPMIVRVTPTGNDYNNGSTWAAAKRTPQGAINAIKTAIEAGTVIGGEVWVKAGISTSYSGSNGRIQDIPSYVYVYGGFAGTETKRSERSWVAYETILDGANSGSVVISQKPGYMVSAIDGFTIQRGRAMGAGIRCTLLSSPAITNNIITNNDASYDKGGGIYCDSNCSPSITYNTIQNNTADVGGGIYCYQSNSPVIAFNTIEDNAASGAGGIYCYRGSPLIHKNRILDHARSEVYGVTPSSGGGIYCEQANRVVVTANRIQNNTGWTAGAAIVLQNVTEAEVKNNLLIENQVPAGYGGGLYIYRQNYSSSAPVLKIINNTFALNSTDWGYGGAAYVNNANVDLINNIYYNNQATYSAYYPGNSIYGNPGYNCTVRYSDAYSQYGSGTLYHYSGAYPDATCRELDPQFCEVTGEDPYWLRPDSQIRDMGQNPSANPAVPLVDYYGLPRPGRDNFTDPGPYEDGPFVRIASPKDGSTYGGGIESIRITAQVSGEATSVSYTATLVDDPETVFDFGPVSQPPYLAVWSDPPQGCFRIVATATFAGGITVDSDPVLVSIQGFCYPEDTEFEIISPYQEAEGGMETLSAAGSSKWLKGGLHVHWYDDNNVLKKIGTKSKKPAEVADMYESMGYDFIAVTEHNHLTPPRGNHLGPNFVWLENCEEVTPYNANGSTWMNHVLAVCVNGELIRGKAENYDITKDTIFGGVTYKKWPMPGGFAESDYEFIPNSKDYKHVLGQNELLFHNVSRTGMFDTIDAMKGLAFIAHPTGKSPLALGHFTHNELFDIACDSILNNRFLAIACYTRATPPRGAHWSSEDGFDAGDSVIELLNCKIAKKYPKRMLPFTYSEEDYTPGLTKAGDTWIYLKVDDPGKYWNTASNHYRSERIKNALKKGAWWSCHTHGSAYTCPELEVTVSGLTVTCISSEAVSWTIRGPQRRGSQITHVIGESDDATVSYTKTLERCGMPDWIVVIAENSSGLVAESNPIRIVPKPGSSNMAAMSSGLVVTYLAPDDYPDEMPPLGYIGGIYDVSGDLQQDPTLTLSFAGADVTELGIDNLRIFYYDPVTSIWSALNSSIDLANQEVSAQITTLGIYTISAVEVADMQPPTVSWLLPLADANITGTTDLDVDAEDNVGVSSVTFYLARGVSERQLAVDSTPANGRWGVSVDFSHYVSGSYVLKAEAMDRAGNVAAAVLPVNVQTSATAPQVTINQPFFDAETGSVIVTGTASDSDGAVAYVHIELDGQVVGVAHLSETDNSWSYAFGEFGPGSHTVKAIAYDEYGNEGMQMINSALPLSTVHLSTDPDSRCQPDQLVTLTGAATGGANVEYRFLAYNGTQWAVLQEYGTSADTCTWTPAAAGSYTLRVYVRERGTTNPEFSRDMHFTVTGPLSAVSLSVDPSPRAVNTPVWLYATPTGGLSWEFKFEANGSVIQDWASADMCHWVPDQTDTYTLAVYAREQGTVSPVFSDTESGYIITGPVTAVSLGVNPQSPQQVNTPITLTAVPTGGGTVEYFFDISEDGGETWSLLRNFETNPTIQWTPTVPGTYKLRVAARDDGTEEDVNPEATLDYVITQ